MTIFSKLPPFPRDPMSQVIWVDRLKEILTNRDTEITNNLVETVTLSQGSPPSQAQWESAYTSQTGKSLPIPAATRLIWYDTSINKVGGIYGTLDNSSGTVYAMQNRYAPGNIVAFDSAEAWDSVSVTYAFGTNLGDHPSLTISLPVSARLHLDYYLSCYFSSGSGSVGADFLLNNQQVGRTYFGVDIDHAWIETQSDNVLRASLVTPVLPRATYEIQAMFGVTNSTPTVEIGGDWGVRQLTVKAVAE